MMLARGVVVSHETIRQWCAKFGVAYAAGLRRRRGPGRGQIAPRRGVHQGQRCPAVSVASGGPRRQRAGHPGAEPQKRRSREAVFGQADEVPAASPAGAGHRQTGQLRRGAPGSDLLSRAPPVQVPQQPGRELPPTRPPARTSHEGLPISRPSPAVSGLLQPDITALPTPSPPAVGHRVPHRDAPPFQGLDEITGLSATP